MKLEELNQIINFALDKNIHIVSDEIYSGTVFDSSRFISIMEALNKRDLQNSDISTQIHIVSSLSKDLGLPGFRIGLIYSNNETLIAAATKMSSFGLVSSQSQYLLSKILADKKFTTMYIKENQLRLKNRQKLLVSWLLEIGIKCLRSNAGLFCWIDMRHLLTSNTFEAETELWKRILYESGLNVSPGSSFHCTEPGWFRICFANMTKETLHLSIRRIKALVDSLECTLLQNYQQQNKVKSLEKNNLFCEHIRLPSLDSERDH